MTEMTREDRVEWYVALGMTRADAEVQVEADKITGDPVFPDEPSTEVTGN